LSGGGGGSGTSSLQAAYDTSGVSIPQIQLSSSNGGLKVYDAATTVGNLLEVKDSTAANLYFAITASATRFNTLDAASGTVLNLGATASPQATSIALNQDTTLAGGHALNFSNTGNGNVIGLVAPTGGGRLCAESASGFSARQSMFAEWFNDGHGAVMGKLRCWWR